MRVLVTRPAGAAEATAARLAATGHEALLLPLFETVPLNWTPPAGEFDAVMLTSAAAARHAGAAAARYQALACYCVGERTAAAARKAGFRDVRTPIVRGATDLLAHIAAAGARGVLHLCGRDVAEAAVPASVHCMACAVYAAETRTWSEAEAERAAGADLALVYSARGGARLAKALGVGARAHMRIAAISAAAAAAASSGWAAVDVAAEPNEDALFAAARLICEKQVSSGRADESA